MVPKILTFNRQRIVRFFSGGRPVCVREPAGGHVAVHGATGQELPGRQQEQMHSP